MPEYCVRVSSSQSGLCLRRTKSLGACPKHRRLMPDQGPSVRLAIFSVGFLLLPHVLACSRSSTTRTALSLLRRFSMLPCYDFSVAFSNSASPVVSALPGTSGAWCFSSKSISQYVPSLRLYLNGVRCRMCGILLPQGKSSTTMVLTPPVLKGASCMLSISHPPHPAP